MSLVIDTTYKRCHKRGHRSKGAAEAHLRGLMRAQSFKPDQKADLQLGVYYCIAKRCRELTEERRETGRVHTKRKANNNVRADG